MIKWHTLNDVFEAFYNQPHSYSKGEIQLACIKGPRNRTFEAYISKLLIRKCFQRCLILACANLWWKKNIPLFYKHVATYKNCPKTTLILKRASGKIKVEFIIYCKGQFRDSNITECLLIRKGQRYDLRTPCNLRSYPPSLILRGGEGGHDTFTCRIVC